MSPGLMTGQFTDYPVNVAAGTDALIVTLAWSDPYGDPMAATHLVNDLDLTVTSLFVPLVTGGELVAYPESSSSGDRSRASS